MSTSHPEATEGYLELNILDTCGLSSWPMNTSDGAGMWDQGKIDNKVANLSPKHIGTTKAEISSRNIRISIDNTKSSLEKWKRSDDWQALRIANKLCVVVVDDRRVHIVGSGREVNNRWRRCGRRTRARGATTATRYGRVDSWCIVCNTISFCSKVPDIPEHLVA